MKSKDVADSCDQGVSLRGLLNLLLCAAVLGTPARYEWPSGPRPRRFSWRVGGYVNFGG